MAAATDPRDLDAAFARIREQDDIQWGLARAEAPMPAPAPPAGTPLDLAWLADVGLGLAVVLVLLLAIWLVRRRFWRWRPDPAPVPMATPDPAPAADSLDAAEAAAGRRQWDEAVHLLLLAALQRLDGVEPSWTGREVITALDLRPPARAALARLVATVERSRFAGRPASAADWATCRHLFTEIAP